MSELVSQSVSHQKKSFSKTFVTSSHTQIGGLSESVLNPLAAGKGEGGCSLVIESIRDKE